jgi:hypothetical protein
MKKNMMCVAHGPHGGVLFRRWRQHRRRLRKPAVAALARASGHLAAGHRLRHRRRPLRPRPGAADRLRLACEGMARNPSAYNRIQLSG